MSNSKSSMIPFPDEFCFDIIISRLPVRSVLTCKCVCKSWLNLISNPDFVEMHLSFHSENSASLMIGGKQDKIDVIYSIGYHSLASSLLFAQIQDDNNNNDDVNAVVGCEEDSNNSVEMESLSPSSSSSTLNLSGIVQMDYPFKYLGLTVDLFGSCKGLVCLWFHDDYSDDSQQFFCLWNPATKEYKKISQAPNRYTYFHIKLYALAYDPKTEDYKFVIVVHSDKTSEMTSLVHIYTLGSDSWTTIVTTPFKFPFVRKSGVLVNGNMHWLAIVRNEYCIASLDISNKIFKEIPLPSEHSELITVGVLEGSLCILVEVGFHVIEVWAMQDYGVRESWTKCYTITHEKITKKITQRTSYLKFMWCFKNGVILFTHWGKLVLYDPKHGRAIERSMNRLLNIMSEENYSESLVSLNSGTYVGGRTTDKAYAEVQILRNRNSVLEVCNAEREASHAVLEARNAQLVASNAVLQRKLHECQVAYKHLEQRVNIQKEVEESKIVEEEEEETTTTKIQGRKRKAGNQYNKEAEESKKVEEEEETTTTKTQGRKRKAGNQYNKEAEESKKVEEEEETTTTKTKGRKRKVENQYNARKVPKRVAAISSRSRKSTDPTDESPAVHQRAEEEQLKLVSLSTGVTLKPYKIEEGSGTVSTSKDSYQKMTVERLRALLKERGLMVKGRKDELIARLRGK